MPTLAHHVRTYPSYLLEDALMFARHLRRSVLMASSLVALAALTGSTGCASDDASASGAAAADLTGVARPPQYVLLAFDGSLNLDFWQESRAFAKSAGAKYAYFISGTYFIPDASKNLYDAPHGLGKGKSAIGWGGNATAIAARYAQVEAARSEGHEMGSHANGHFDGSNWTEADWESEFTQFDSIIFKGAGVPTPSLGFGPKEVFGFRAPQLGHSPGLYTVLARHGYTYDTSKTAPTNYWPQLQGGVWNFPLAEIRIVGSGKKTLSMDYNFYFADSKGEPDAANAATYQKQMIDTYTQYFESNYFGNRAPVHIGHHFSKWNGGAYWSAMQAFTKKVCGLPEVKCVTYSELTKFVNDNKANLPAFQAGSFTKMPRPPSSEPIDVSAAFTDEERAEALSVHENHNDEGDE